MNLYYASVFDGHSTTYTPIYADTYEQAAARFRNAPPGYIWAVVPEEEAVRLGWV